MKEYYGFIYQWMDSSNGFKYVGSHYGSEDDGYVSSNTIMNRVHKRRPNDVTRTILEYIKVDDKKFLYEREQFYLDMINNDELYNSTNRKNKTIKYYNMKKHAAGGNGVGSNGVLRDKQKYYHKDTLVQKFFSKDEKIGDEWIKGVPSSKISCKGKRWYKNLSTGENKRFTEEPKCGNWKIGKSYNKNSGKTGTRKKISTPNGIFDSTVECAEYYNIVRQTVSERCKSENTKWHDWSFLEE